MKGMANAIPPLPKQPPFRLVKIVLALTLVWVTNGEAAPLASENPFPKCGLYSVTGPLRVNQSGDFLIVLYPKRAAEKELLVTTADGVLLASHLNGWVEARVQVKFIPQFPHRPFAWLETLKPISKKETVIKRLKDWPCDRSYQN